MERKELKPTDIIQCVRCGKSEFVGNAGLWNVVYDAGVATCFICPDCQTQDEFLEAEVNDSLTDYSKTIKVHNLDELLDHFRPQWRKALEAIASGEVELGNQQFAECLERFRKGFNALNRYNFDAQLRNTGEAFELLKELGEFPR